MEIAKQPGRSPLAERLPRVGWGRASAAVFSLITAALAGWLGLPFASGGPGRAVHLPGTTTRGHHAIEDACDQCHTPFNGVTNEACNRCHGAPLAAAGDSHPEAKFTDPRNAERVRRLDARACVTCHREHAPDRTGPSGLTLPPDLCAACHEDVAVERPSHRGLSFSRCADSGCHHFHDNRSLYEDFLAQHLREPDTSAPARVPVRAHPQGAPTRAHWAADGAPAEALADATAIAEWQASEHARAGVGCAACHRAREGGPWIARPDHAACAGCHGGEVQGFLGGMHGSRLAAGLSPMTPALAVLPMKAAARDRQLGCGSCHAAHRYDTRRAAAAACLGCHDDGHSRAWSGSRHAALWGAEIAGDAEEGTGVSCATCHLPREAHRSAGAVVVRAQHDQNADLRPSDKMIRAVCTPCHGLGFAMDALADTALAARCFAGRPAKHVESLSMVERRIREKAGRVSGGWKEGR